VLRGIRVFWVAGIVAAAGVVAPLPAAWGAAAPASPAASGELGYQAAGYGTEVTVSGIVQSGKSALSTLGCTSTTGITHTNTAASVGVPGVLNTGTIDTSAASETTATGTASSGSSTVQGVSALGGLVGATTVESVSTTSRDSTTGALSTSAAGTEFLGLSVLGVPITGTPAPNTKLTLPGVGYVILNQQFGHVYKKTAALTVIGIHVVVTLPTPIAPIGTNVIVGFATSSLGGPVAGLLSGLSYGASAKVLGGVILAGKEFPQPLACIGTNGITKSNTGVGLNLLGEVTSGTVVDTAEGLANRKVASDATSSTIEGLNLGSGLVTATTIEAAVSAQGNPPTFTDSSQFIGLTVTGFPGLSSNPPPNTKLSLPGIGTLWLHKVTKNATTETVIMVQLDVTAAGNPLGLAVGTQVNVAYASVDIQ
jgi:hypothetical protein